MVLKLTLGVTVLETMPLSALGPETLVNCNCSKSSCDASLKV